MVRWANPTTAEEAEAIIVSAEGILPQLIDDELEIACKKLALFAGSFNRAWSSDQRHRLVKVLADVGYPALDFILEVLVDLPRQEQFDITRLFVRFLIEKESRCQ
jgi:hypothetical protein